MKKSIFVVCIVLLLIVSLLLPSRSVVYAQSATIYTTNFNSGYSGWTSSGNVSSVSSPAIQPKSVRLRGSASVTRTVSTIGYSNISVTWNMAASSLENGDYCYIEVNTGSNWTAIGSITNGQDFSTYYNGTADNIAGANQNANFQVRYRGNGATTGDYCYAEDITVTGTSGASPTNTPTPTNTPQGPTPTPPPGGSVPGDPLTGNGNVTRTLLTYNDLFNGSSSTPVDDSAFALPVNAAMPDHAFEGRLELSNEATSGGFSEIKDSFAYTGNGDHPRKHLP
ncbi:MAG: hypothetical protein KJZ52_09685, partial [Anaerolineales bacterium]|nr:hypothetical protein [Anaerolineales bacterium]